MTDRVLFFQTGLARKNQVEEVISKALGKLDIECWFRVNLVLSKEGTKLGHAYVWFSTPKAVNAIIGKNYDGSERVEKVDDPDWSPPDGSLEEALLKFRSDLQESGNSSSSDSWADEPSEHDITSLYVCPKITRKLPPLTVLENYSYDDDQIEYIKQKEPEGSAIPKYGHLSDPSVAFPPTVEEGCCPNVLLCRNVPKWVTRDQLHKMFRTYFDKDPDLELPKFYPRINLLDKKTHRMAFVTFDKDQDHALQLHHMVKRINVFIPDTGTDEKTALSGLEPPKRFRSLAFSFAYDNGNDENWTE